MRFETVLELERRFRQASDRPGPRGANRGLIPGVERGAHTMPGGQTCRERRFFGSRQFGVTFSRLRIPAQAVGLARRTMDAPVRERSLEILGGNERFFDMTHGVRHRAKAKRDASLNLPRQTLP